MIAAKKSSTPQIPSNSEGRNNSEESDELESSSEPCTEREEENCEEEDEYTSTATPATGLVSVRNHSLFSSFLLTYLFLS